MTVNDRWHPKNVTVEDRYYGIYFHLLAMKYVVFGFLVESFTMGTSCCSTTSIDQVFWQDQFHQVKSKITLRQCCSSDFTFNFNRNNDKIFPQNIYTKHKSRSLDLINCFADTHLLKVSYLLIDLSLERPYLMQG